MSTSELSGRAEALLGAHRRDAPLLLPNIWDVASARAVEQAGFAALATSSSAIAASLGEADTNSMGIELAFGVIARIARAVSVPLTCDIEAGYGLDPAELANALIDAGGVGCNYEDSSHTGANVVATELHASRIAAMREAAEKIGVHLVINARTDVVLHQIGDEAEQLESAIARGRAYLAAGADCVYPIMLSGPDRIAAFVNAIDAPVNVNLRMGREKVSELTSLGVRRISYAGGYFRRVFEEATRMAAAIAADPDSLYG